MAGNAQTTLTAEQQEARRGRITSTRMVKLVRGEALAVFNEMQGISPPLKDNDRMKAGRYFELPALTWACEENGWDFKHQPGTVIAGRYATSPDAYLFTDEGEEIGEVKWRAPDQAAKYATDEATEDEVVQTTWHEGVTGKHAGRVIVALGGQKPRVYPVPWDAELWAGLREIADRFLRDHVDTGRAPPMDASDAAAEYLRSKFPKHSAPMLAGDEKAQALVAEYLAAHGAEKDARARKDAAGNALRALIGEAEGIAGQGWKATWKSTKGSPETDWEALAAFLMLKAEPAERERNIRRFTQEKPGGRRLLCTIKGQKETP